MADIFRLSALSENTNLQTRYNNMLAGNLPANGVYESIQTVTVGSGGASSVSFTSIPSTYKHLQLRIFAQSTSTLNSLTSAVGQFNGDTSTANYVRHVVQGDGTNVASTATTAANGVTLSTVYMPGNANTFGVGIADILDYTNTNKYKTTKALRGFDGNSTGQVIFSSGAWLSTAAITSITFFSNDGFNFAQNSSFALYGVK